MKRKALTVLLMASMLGSALAGCGSSAEKELTTVETEDETAKADGGEAALTGSITVASNRTDIEDKLVSYAQKFMDEHPGTNVTFETIKEYDDVVATRIAGGEAPDIFYVVDPINQDTYKDYFLPIDDLDFTADDILFYENGRGTDGNLYVLPLTVSYCGMVYNKAAFKEAGIEKVPMTVDEFYDDCEKLKAAGITPVGTAFKDIWPIYAWCGWGEVNITAGDNRGENKYPDQDEIYDDTMLASMNIMRELYKRGYLEDDIMSANWDQFKLDLSQGKVAMHYSETWLPSQFVELGAKQEDIGMFPFPGAKNIKAGEGKKWGISKDTSSPELAKAFLSYMLENPVEPTDIPSNTSIEVSDPFVAELLSYGVEPLSPIVGDARFSNIKNDIELDGQKFFLTYVMEESDEKAAELIADWNKKWAEARVNY
ncbi:ABC transporter substrate-binding protein [Butyrivibrio sp. MC2013]|uniref:ABC transporter substrate-binding protein n=1 Tax=Butyrivibrio sp. MC2013 TaxID=1280686 RepID=UPI0003F569C7|nr:ABC transporter substrate-binding protein [Butyrivibrio sp. MC2013]